MWRGTSNLVAGKTFVRIADFIFFLLRQLRSVVWGITRVSPESDLRQRWEEATKPTELVISKRIQWINDNGPNAGSLILKRVVEHWQKKAFRLAASRSCCYNQAPPILGALKTAHLVLVKWTGWVKCLNRKVA